MKDNFSRRQFIAASSLLLGAAALPASAAANTQDLLNTWHPNSRGAKLRVALIGTGSRGAGMWGRDLQRNYSNELNFVGLCDKNKGRLAFAKQYIGTACPTYTDFEKMMKESKPDLLIVCTMDSTHHDFIIRGMELGANVLTEKPMTTDEKKVQAIIDAEKRTGKQCRVTFNYRYSPHRAKIWELL